MTFRFDDGADRLLGMGKQDWARVHALMALSFLSLVGLHLWVNWRWLSAILVRCRWPTIVVAIAGLATLATALLAP
jgi:hypothetical protein